MRYLMLIVVDEAGEDGPTGEEMQVWLDEMDRRGVAREGNALRSVSEATTIRVRDDQVLVTDGPYAETKEQIGGFGIIDCADLDEAIEIAAKHPIARFGMIDLRPIWEG